MTAEKSFLSALEAFRDARTEEAHAEACRRALDYVDTVRDSISVQELIVSIKRFAFQAGLIDTLESRPGDTRAIHDARVDTIIGRAIAHYFAR